MRLKLLKWATARPLLYFCFSDDIVTTNWQNTVGADYNLRLSLPGCRTYNLIKLNNKDMQYEYFLGC